MTNDRVSTNSELDNTGGCFAKGTPVHVHEGVKAINELRAGDLVLSAPADGTGTTSYRRVANTFVHQQRTIRQISTYAAEKGTQYFVSATDNHQFWAEGRGWTRARDLDRHMALRGVDGSPKRVDSQWPVYRTDQPGIGWVQMLSDVTSSYGSCFDYANYDVAPNANFGEYPPPGVLESDQPLLTITVYGIEVEEWHTYFAGYDGLWVSDADRAP